MEQKTEQKFLWEINIIWIVLSKYERAGSDEQGMIFSTFIHICPRGILPKL